MIDTRVAERYVLVAPLGSGGEARVYRAHDEASGEEVAVRLALEETTIAPTPAHVSHENWVRLFESGVDPRHGAYQVFELLEGRTLGQTVGSAPLARDEWRSFVDQSLRAVEAVHAAGAIHGDLNADNFLRTASLWKLLELPFFRFDVPAGRSAMFGSIYTLAPEQINGTKPDVVSDIYSLGCLYYFAASSAWPHAGSSVQEVAVDCLMHPPRHLGDAAPGLPAGWSEWVMRLLVAQPKDRVPTIATARHLLADAVA